MRMLPPMDMQQAHLVQVQLTVAEAKLCCGYLAAIMEDLHYADVFQ